MAKVRIEGTDLVFDAPDGEDLLEVMQSNGHPIATSCGGVASCGLCRLTVISGGEHLSPIKPQEVHHLGSVAKVLGLRLACQSHVVGDGEIVVRVPEVDDVEERKRRKAERLRVAPPRREPIRDAAPMSSRGEAPPRSQRPKIEWRPRILQATPATPPVSDEPSKKDGPRGDGEPT